MIASSSYSDQDLELVLIFLAELRAHEIIGCFHAGDFIWRTYSPMFESA